MGEQKPIQSPFNAKSTAAEVIKGIDLAGKLAIVTGGHSGIGIETVKALAGAGAEIVVPARDVVKSKAALSGVAGKISVASMDLADLASVRRFVAEIRATRKAVHLLINNAGVMACPEARVGKGWELQFATNHIGHFALTNELAPLLKAAKGARVVCLSSTAHKMSAIRWNDIHFAAEPYDKWVAYGQSKTANSLFAVELDARMKGDGVRAFAVHPGGIMTPLQRHLQLEEMVAAGWINEKGEPTEMSKGLFKTPEQGASTTAFAATSGFLDGAGGVYCEDCNIAALADADAPRWSMVAAHAVDKDEAVRLWSATEKMISTA